jgi:hypothetical protein
MCQIVKHQLLRKVLSIWVLNCITDCLRKSDGCKDSKHTLQVFLLDHPFYTLYEFLLDGR